MKAVIYERFGGPEVLKITREKTPEPGRNKLLVRVRAASMNPLDWKLRSGKMTILAGRVFPRHLGIDYSGVIEKCGPGVVGLKPGDSVLGHTDLFEPEQGSFAEKCIASAEHAMRKPSRLSDAQAAAVPMAGLSALQSLHRCKVGPKKKVMIIGASGGIGTFAIQIAKALGAHVTAVCRTHGVETCRELGADLVVDRLKDDPLKSRGLFDAILDLPPAHSFLKCRHLLTSRGIYLSALPGPGVVFSRVWSRLSGSKGVRMLILRPSAGDLKELGTMLAEGSVKPIVSRTFEFNEENVRQMHRLGQEGKVVGKLVVEMPGD